MRIEIINTDLDTNTKNLLELMEICKPDPRLLGIPKEMFGDIDEKTL